MIATTYGSDDVYLLDVLPDWRNRVSADFDIVADLVRGLTDREARRAHAASLRVTRYTYTCTLTGDIARRTSASLRDYQTQPVIAPLWTCGVWWKDRASRTVAGGLYVVFSADRTQYEIYESSEPSWPTNYAIVYPALWGRLEKRITSDIDAEVIEFQVDFVEASKVEWALAPAAQVWTTGPSPSGSWASPPKVFPLAANFVEPQHSFEVSILRQNIGTGRIPMETLYPQTNARAQDLLYTAKDSDVGTLLRFFQEYGHGKAFWFSNWSPALILTAAVGASDTVIHVEDSSGVSAGDWLAFGPDQSQTARVLSKTDTTVTLDAAPGVVRFGSLVAQLVLGRFGKTRITIDWSRPDYGNARLPIRELPPEYTPASDETLGTTLGVLPTRCYLYELSRTLDSDQFIDRYTSFENDLTYGGNSYTRSETVKTTHSDIRQGIAADRDDVTLTQSGASTGALALLASLKSEAPLYLTIMQGEVSGSTATNVVVVFSGEIVSASVTGKRITAKCVPGGSVFDQKLPRLFLQQTDNATLFDTANALSKDDWKWTAQIDDPGSGGYPFEFALKNLARVSGPTPTYGTDYFSGGWIEFGSGASWCRRSILLTSSVSGGGNVTVTLDRDPDPFPSVDDNVVLYPGYDLTADVCKSKFDNYENFIGQPFIPVANPSVVAAASKPTGGGKK